MSLPADELERLRDAYAASLHDVCVIHRQLDGGTEDDFGAPELEDTDSDEIACGYDETGGFMKIAGVLQPVDVDATVRLPYGTTLGDDDILEIVEHAGDDVNKMYRQAAPETVGLAGVVVMLKSVQP